jgi:hypothetical protein
MTGMSCAFLLTKSSDLPLYYFLFSFICTVMLLLKVVTSKYPVVGGFNSRDA